MANPVLLGASGFVPHSLGVAGAVTVAFAVLARAVRGVTLSGAIAGGAICFVLYACGGPGSFAALVAVFVVTWAATRFGYSQKQKLGTAEKREGRNAWQVLANLLIATAGTAIFALTQRAEFLLAASAAFSEAAADTVSSEFGQALGRDAWLITSWKRVPAGANGGVTVAGTLAGVLAATLVSLVLVLSGTLPWRWLGFSVTAALAGTVVDSFLGACLERPRLLNNNAVNFLSTLAAAGTALLLA